MFGENREEKSHVFRFFRTMVEEPESQRENRREMKQGRGYLKVRSAGKVKVCKENVLVNMLIILNSNTSRKLPEVRHHFHSEVL